VLFDLVDELEHPGLELVLVLRLEVLEVIVAGMNDLVDADLALAQTVAEVAYILHGERKAVDDLGSLALALLDPLGDGDLASLESRGTVPISLR